MHVEQAAIYLHAGRLHQVGYNPRPFTPLIVVYYKVMFWFLMLFYREKLQSPNGVLPWAWRWVLPNTKFVFGNWMNVRELRDGRTRMTSWDNEGLRLEFWLRLFFVVVVFAVLAWFTDYAFLMFVPLRTFTWSGSGNRSVAANWDKGTELSDTRPAPTGASTDATFGQPAMNTMCRTSGGRAIAALRDGATQDLVVYYTDNDWSTSTRVVVDNTNNHAWQTIAVDSTDKVYITSRDGSNVYLHSSDDEGATWVSSTNIAAGVSNTPDNITMLLIDNDDYLHFLWRTVTNAEIMYCVSDTASPDADDFNAGGTPWDIESYKGAADSTAETVDSGFSFTGAFQFDACLFDDGSDNIAVTWDNAVNTVYFRKKADDEAWSSAAARVTVDSSSATFPCIAVANDDSTFLIGLRSSLKPGLRGSDDGGATWSSFVYIDAANNSNGLGMSFDGDYFWVTVDHATETTWSQVYVDPSTGTPSVIDGDNAIAGTVPANTQRVATVRWQRFHMNSPEKVDILFTDSTDSKSEVLILAPGIPGEIDDVVLDGTSNSTLTWNTAGAVKSIDMQNGSSAQISGTARVETTGNCTNNSSAALLADAGLTVGGALTNSGTSGVRMRGNCDVTGTITNGSSAQIDLDAISVDINLRATAIVNTGIVLLTNHTVNKVIINGFAAGSEVVWTSVGPDFDGAALAGNVELGTGSTPGVDFSTNSVSCSLGLASVTLSADCMFGPLTMSASSTLISATGTTHELSGDFNRNGGTFTVNNSEWVCTANLTLNGTVYYDLTINDGVTVTLAGDIEIENQLDLNTTGELDLDSNQCQFTGNGVTPITGTGTLTGPGTMDFAPSGGSSTQTVPARTDYPTVTMSGSDASRVVTLGGACTFAAFDGTIGAPTGSISLALSTYTLTCLDMTLGDADITLTGNSGTLQMEGDCDLSTGTYTPGTSTLLMATPSPLAQTTLTTGAGSSYIFSLHVHNTGGVVLDGVQTDIGDFSGNPEIDINPSVVFTLNQTLRILNVAAQNFDNDGTIAEGTGSPELIFLFEDAGTVNMFQSTNSPGTINVDTTFRATAASVAGSLASWGSAGSAVNWSSTRDLTIESLAGGSIFMSCNFNGPSGTSITCRSLTINDLNTGTVTFTGTTTVSGSWDSTNAGADFQFANTTDTVNLTGTGSVGILAADSFENLGLGDASQTTTLATEITVNQVCTVLGADGTITGAFKIVLKDNNSTCWAGSGAGQTLTFTSVVYNPSGSPSGSHRVGGYFPEVEFESDFSGGAWSSTAGSNFVVTDDFLMSSSSGVTIDMADYGITCVNLTISAVDEVNNSTVGASAVVVFSTSFVNLDGDLDLTSPASGSLNFNGNPIITCSGTSTLTYTNLSSTTVNFTYTNWDIQNSSEVTIDGSAGTNPIAVSGRTISVAQPDICKFDKVNLTAVGIGSILEINSAQLANTPSIKVQWNDCTFTNLVAGEYTLEVTASWTPATNDYFVGCTFDDNVLNSGGGHVHMTQCDITYGRATSGSIISVGSVASASGPVNLWGQMATTDIIDTLTGRDMSLREAFLDGTFQSGDQQTRWTADTVLSVDSVVTETHLVSGDPVSTTQINVDANLTVNGTSSTVMAQSIAALVITAGFQFEWSPASGGPYTMDIYDDWNVGGTLVLSSAVTSTFRFQTDTKIVTSGFSGPVLTISDIDFANQSHVALTNGGKIHIPEGTGHTLTGCSFTGMGGSSHPDGAGTILVDGASGGTLSKCTFPTGGTSGVFVRVTSANTWTFETSQFGTGATYGFQVTVTAPDMKIQHNRIAATRSVRLEAAFEGRIQHCLLEGTAFGIDVTETIRYGAISTTVITSSSPISVASTKKLHLADCYFNEDNVSTTGEVYSWRHNRVNNKQFFMNSDPCVDSNYWSIVNQDEFEWSASGGAGEWDISADNKWEASGNVSTLDSVFIPVTPAAAASTKDYYVQFRGDVAQVTVRGYRADQTTVTVTKTKTADFANPSTDLYTVTLTVDEFTEYVDFQVDGDALGEVFYDAEVRETDSSGQLYFSEDLANHYRWSVAGAGIDMLSHELSFASGGSRKILTFGEADYDALDMTCHVGDLGAAGDLFAWVVAYVDSNNYYYMELDYDNSQLRLHKVDGGTDTVLYNAVNHAGGAIFPLTDPSTFRLKWNDPNETDTGSFKVWIAGNLVDNGDWRTGTSATPIGGSEDYVTDTTHTAGLVGYSGRAVTIDDVTIQHNGFYTRDTDHLVDPGVLAITIKSDGEFDPHDGTFNVSSDLLIVLSGGTDSQSNITWTDTVMPTDIYGTTTISCNTSLETSGDIVIHANGQLNLRGVTIRHSDNSQRWELVTEGSTRVPIFDIIGSTLLNVKAHFRDLDVAGGKKYVLDDNYEFIGDTAFPKRGITVQSNSLFGRIGNKNFVKSHGDDVFEIPFTTYNDLCLYQQLEVWKKGENLLEFVGPTGGIATCKIVDLESLPLDPGDPFTHRFIVTLQQWT